jgi:hypothetical protein
MRTETEFAPLSPNAVRAYYYNYKTKGTLY